MQVFGLTVLRTKLLPRLTAPLSRLGGGWYPMIREAFAGAWQKNVETPLVDVLTFGAVFSCVTLIASDIAKMRIRLTTLDEETGIWKETTSPTFSPVIRKPNRFQIRIMFIMQWVISKLTHGNTYVLKERDKRNAVVALYVLDPQRVTVLLAPDGSVWYQLATDTLAGVNSPDGLFAVPASEIIHDIMYPLYHPLIGISPIHACGLAAMQGLRMQHNSAKFFGNGSQPGGILTAPGAIGQETADRLKTYWNENYTGDNVGKVAVLGDGLKFEAMTIKAVDAQLIEQLKWTGESVCGCFHVPGYKVGVGPAPAFNNIEALDQAYYSQALQILIECIESLLDEGVQIGEKDGYEFVLDDLMRMDSATLMDVVVKGVGGAIYSPNEARRKFNLPPVKGGESPYLQQQNYALSALAARDAMGPPTTPGSPADNGQRPPAAGGTGTPSGAQKSLELSDGALLSEIALEIMRKVQDIDYAA